MAEGLYGVEIASALHHDALDVAYARQQRVRHHHGHHDEHGATGLAERRERRQEREVGHRQRPGYRAQGQAAAPDAEHEDGRQAELLRQLAEEHPHERLEAHVAGEQHECRDHGVVQREGRQEEQRDGDERYKRPEQEIPVAALVDGERGDQQQHGGRAAGEQRQQLRGEVGRRQDDLRGQRAERAQREAEQQHWEREAQAERPFVHRQRVEDGYGVAHGIAHRREVPQNGQLQQRQAGGEHARVGRGHHMERDGVDGHGYDDGHGRVHDDGGGAVARIGGAPEQQQQGRSDARGHTGEHGGRYAQRPGQRGGEHGERARRGEDTRSEQHALGGVELEEFLVGYGGEQKRQPEHHDGDEENIRYEGVRLAEEPLGRGDLEDGVRSEHGSVDPCLVYAEAQGQDIELSLRPHASVVVYGDAREVDGHGRFFFAFPCRGDHRT